jgi:NAD(P)H-dependent FMN reductase
MFDNANNLKILGIAGSLRERSSSQFALEYAMNLLKQRGCSSRNFDLRSANLPFCNGNPDEQSRAFPVVAALRNAVSQAHGLVLVTPEYHGGISGVLKNALDMLDTKHLAGKVVGIVSVLGGPANANAWNELSRIMRCCHAWVIPQYVAIGRASSVFVDGQISDVDLRVRFQEFADSLTRSAVRLCGLDQPEIKTQKAPVNLTTATTRNPFNENVTSIS